MSGDEDEHRLEPNGVGLLTVQRKDRLRHYQLDGARWPRFGSFWLRIILDSRETREHNSRASLRVILVVSLAKTDPLSIGT